VRRDDEFEQQLAGLLEDGPTGAPDGPVASALAHAHNHPRGRIARHRPWRFVMSQYPVSGVQSGPARQHALVPLLALGAVAAALVVAVAWSGVLPFGRPPASVPGAAVAPASPAATLNSSPDPATSSTLGGYTVDDLAGTWRGDVLVPWFGPNWESDPTKDTTWRLDMTIDACADAQSCGAWTFTTESLGGTGKAATCSGTLTYHGPYEDHAAFQFAEIITGSTGPAGCQAATLVMTPLASGARAGIEERSNGIWMSWGLVSKASTP
jgi:hypothetical protein